MGKPTSKKEESGTNLFEKILLAVSFTAPVIAFLVFKVTDYLNLANSLAGAAMLFLLAKANIFGNVVSMVFSITYSVVSYRFRYYGEMMLYLGLYLPIEVFTLFVWLRNRYAGSNVVKVEVTKAIDFLWGTLLSSIITLGAYFVLKALGTENLPWSTVSVFTSMLACYFLLKRNSVYALFYVINDVILIILWLYAAMKDSSYACLVVSFICFLLNDSYAFFSWSRIRRKQELNCQHK